MRIWPIGGKLFPGAEAVIEGQDAKHISSVLRLEPGDILNVADDTNGVFKAVIGVLSKNKVSVKIINALSQVKLKEPHVYVAVGISRPDVMELVVQKAVELGCSGFLPLITGRSAAISLQKVERFGRIAREACKQCGRGEMMEIFPPAGLEALPEGDLKLALWEDERERTLKTALQANEKPAKIVLVIGPAGGFSSEEVGVLKSSGFVTAGLGPLILRTETAAISLVAVVNHHFGRF